MGSKKCRVCQIEKPTDQFYKSGNAYADGRSTECAECENKRKKARRQPKSPNKCVGQEYPNTFLTILAKSVRIERINKKNGNTYKDAFIEVKCRCGVTKKVCFGSLKAGSITSCQSENCEYSSSGRRHKNSLLIDDGVFFINKHTIKNLKKGAKQRGIYWDESLDDGKFFGDLYRKQNGKCSYTGISMPCGKTSVDREWSPQRVDSNEVYVKENLTLYHTAINMVMNCYTEEEMDLLVFLRSPLIPEEKKQRFKNMSDEQYRKVFNNAIARMHKRKLKKDKES